MRFTSEAGAVGMPADQRVPDGRPAAWPHDDPSRPGWTFDGWFDGDVAWDFTRPVTGDVTLTARWGRWSSGPERGPWKGGTDVRTQSPTDPVRFAQVSGGNNHSLGLGSDGAAYAWGYNYYGQLGDGTTNQRNTP
ncbi:InlB B-repeat-containing protein, partial [Bifidobacterium indicum]|uniref:InlB B-repeat-containing protein n=1 Tax=Bifidobacterium indicum TaxID=1691 RepID=UPI0030D75237